MPFPLNRLILLVLMVLAALAGTFLRPTISLANERPLIDLKAMVPVAFGDWQELRDTGVQIIDPQQQQMLDKLYSETLSRSYINKEGYRIMLSIAYGKNQSDALQLHKPEVCYPAQGFMLITNQRATLDVSNGNPIAATRLTTSLGPRFEPITYWTVVGDHITKGGIDKKLTEMGYATQGRIPDGMLVRVSSIDRDTDQAFAMQNKFAAEMVQAIAPDMRNRFAGDPKLN